MGQHRTDTLRNMASALIAIGLLAACDGNSDSVTVTYDETDKGIIMPQPKLAEREKCFGIALAQHNDCAAGKGTDCAGTADKDYIPHYWKYVESGSCAALGGLPEAPETPYISQK
jgi:uncharacterized membrane protein